MQSPARKIRISVAKQRLDLKEGRKIVASFPVSTSSRGTGSEEGSYKTPIGKFVISDKIGAGAPHGTVFKSRVSTGKVGSEKDPADLVQTRILWLDGTQAHNANTHDRYIYIHGTNHESAIGTPASHGCIRMKNADVARLYALVRKGTEVFIAE